MPLAAEAVVVLPFALYNFSKKKKPVGDFYASNSAESLTLMFYSEFLIFSAYLVLTNMEAGALY